MLAKSHTRWRIPTIVRLMAALCVVYDISRDHIKGHYFPHVVNIAGVFILCIDLRRLCRVIHKIWPYFHGASTNMDEQTSVKRSAVARIDTRRSL